MYLKKVADPLFKFVLMGCQMSTNKSHGRLKYIYSDDQAPFVSKLLAKPYFHAALH
jgi:hypothetical protein